MRILLVEDEEGIQQVVQKYFELRQAEVVLADTGEEAFRLAISEEFDLILLDFNLPGWNGVEAVKALNLIDKKPKIIVNTAYDIDALRNELKSYDNVIGYIAKPFKLDSLWNAIEEAISA